MGIVDLGQHNRKGSPCVRSAGFFFTIEVP